jgi:RNA-directed DNA polymerase
MSKPRQFAISEVVVEEAYRRVKANKGAAGVDGETIDEFERDLEGNLYKLWNRMSSGSYFPPPVRSVEIPKPGGKGVRVLGVPTIADRIAQTVAAMYLEPEVEPIFHPDSYGYRPGRSAKQAVGRCRERCWKTDWVIDLDIKAFFDTIPHSLIMRAVRHHTDLKWILLYVQRWLEAPMQREDGSLVARDRGSPQGSAISPLLANLFMHYAFDSWMQRESPSVGFERYCDDVVVHCVSKAQAEFVKAATGRRLEECGLEMHPEKTRIVYCKDGKRRGSYEPKRFVFLGYEFRARSIRTKDGKRFEGFSPAISPEEGKRIRQEMRDWHLNRAVGQTLTELAQWVNPRVRGWINYYGAFYRSELSASLRSLNEHLARWAQRKYKRLRGRPGRTYRFLSRVAEREPDLFAHWTIGLRPSWIARAE